MDVINALKQEKAIASEKKHSPFVTRILNLFGSDPTIRKRNLFSIWGVVFFASSVVLMDKYGNQLAI